MAVAFDAVPLATCEVGYFDRDVAVVHGDGTQLGQAAPFGQVVDIDVQRQAVLQTVDQPGIHDEVHSAVSADFLRLLLVLGNQRTFVFPHQCLCICL